MRQSDQPHNFIKLHCTVWNTMEVHPRRIRRMHWPNRMADFLTKRNRFKSIRSKRIGESIRIATRNALVHGPIYWRWRWVVYMQRSY